MNKKIVIVIPHYNNPQGLEDSLKSINEPFNVDVIIVDDGSKIKFDENQIKLSYNNNGTIHFKYLTQNQGIENALNEGLTLAKSLKYPLIGRLDAGDFFLKNKLNKQLEYLSQNPNVKLLGTWVNVVNEKRELLYVLEHPTSYDEIRKKMYLNSMFVHPSVVFYTSVLESVGGYPTNRLAAEDYAFFFKITKQYKVANLSEPLVDYVVSENSVSTQKRRLQVKNRIKIILDNFYFGFYPIYGLLRNIPLLFTSRETTTYLKKIFSKK